MKSKNMGPQMGPEMVPGMGPGMGRGVGSIFWRPLLTALALALLLVAVPALGPAGQPDRFVDVVRLHLMWTNDLHGHIAPEGARFMNPNFPPPLGGAPSAARYIKKVRAEAKESGEPVLLVDVGDMFQGTPIGTKTAGEAVIDYFNAIGYDFVVPGNHEFDLGFEVAVNLAAKSKFPWVCANLCDEKTGLCVNWCTPTLMIEKSGIQIGVIGIITPGTEHMAFPDHIKGLKFKPMPEAIATERDRLRAEGADLIFLAIHEGLPYDPQEGWQKIAEGQDDESQQERQQTYGRYGQESGLNLMELVNQVPGIDFAVGGHTHRGYPEPWIDPVNHTLCFETYGNGSSLGHVILKIDRKTRSLIGYETPHDRGTIVTLFEDELWPEDEITEVLRPWREKTDAEMDKVIGQAVINLGRGEPGSNLIGNLVTDAMVAFFEADFSFQNLGGLRADLPAGDLTARDVFGVLPFGNELLQVTMKGEMVRRVVERKLLDGSGGICIGGARVVFDQNRPAWDRVVSFEVAGQPLDPARNYQVIATNYLMEGNSGLDFLTSIDEEDIELTQITTAEAVEKYLKLNSPVRPTVDGRWVEKKGVPQAEYLGGPVVAVP